MPKKVKAANGEGSVYWSNWFGRYVAEATVGYENGQVRRRRLYGPKNDRSKAAKLGVEERIKPYVSRTPSTRASAIEPLEKFAKRWIRNAPVRSNTKDYYLTMSAHLGRLGAKRIAEIAPADVRRHLDALVDVGERTKRGVFSLIHRVLQEATQLEVIARNPAANVKPPRMPTREARALTGAEVALLLELVRGDRLEALVILALTSTMGPAEMLALRRRDLHLAGGYLWVTHDLVTTSANGYRPTLEPTKTARRHRRIDLPPLTVAALRQRLKFCLTEGSGEFLFTNTKGGLIRPHGLRLYWWRPLIRSVVLEAKKRGQDFPAGLRLYDLRHTANAIMSHAGVPIELASARMGHSSIKTTDDQYGHRWAGSGKRVASQIQEWFDEAVFQEA